MPSPKNEFLDAATEQEISQRIARVIRDLGDPDPPISIPDVLHLLDLDKQYYSLCPNGIISEVVHSVKMAGKELIKKPQRLLDVIRKFDLKALYLPRYKRILIDSSLPDAKVRWNEAHEIAHSLIPWHEALMMGDSRYSLDPACYERIETEANFGAGQLLFLGSKFKDAMGGKECNIETVRQLSEIFGNTITSALWRYVEFSNGPVIGTISEHPCRLSTEFDLEKPFRYLIRSRDYAGRFSNIPDSEIFYQIQCYCCDRRGGVLGSREVTLTDTAGKSHVFYFQTFYNGHEALTLGTCQTSSAKSFYIGDISN